MRSVDAFGIETESLWNGCAQNVKGDRVIAGFVQRNVCAGIELGQIAGLNAALLRIGDVAKEGIACTHINRITIPCSDSATQRVGFDFDFVTCRHRRRADVRESIFARCY